MAYYGSQGKIAFRSQDLIGVQATQLISLPSVIINFLLLSNFKANFWNTPMNLYVSVNLATGSCSFSGGGAFGHIINIFPAAVDYGPDWVFDSLTQIEVCSDAGGYIGCTIQNLKITSSYYSLAGYLDLANSGWFPP